MLLAAICGVFGTASASTHYVDLNGTNAVSPFTSWATAATSIQDAIDAAADGERVLVADGIYAAGGQVFYEVTNRVAITKAITVESVHGAATTIIQGYLDQGRMGPIFSPNCVRCAYLTNGAALIGFTLTNGATSFGGSGGGAYCESVDARVLNCLFISNSAANLGGGICNGTALDCDLSGNSGGTGGGAYGCVLSNCTLAANSSGFYGGGADSSTLWNCILSTNAGWAGGGAGRSVLHHCKLLGNAGFAEGGGGARDSDLDNCLLVGNDGGRFGGGAEHCTLNQCTVVGNFADWAGGVDQTPSTNCAIYDNTANISNPNTRDSVLDHCCTTPDEGPGSITNAPIFVDAAAGNFHLRGGDSSGSICASQSGDLRESDLFVDHALAGVFMHRIVSDKDERGLGAGALA